MMQKICALAAAGVLLLAPTLANAIPNVPFAPGSSFEHKSIADWTEAWWTWAAGLPATGNAFDDPTGALANQNNNGPVFFVAGYFSLPVGYMQPPVQRSFSVPAGKPILVALLNQPALQFSEADVDFIISSFRASSLTAVIDGTSVPNPYQYLETTGIFSAGPIVPGTLGSSLFATPGFPGVPPDCLPTDLCPSASTGYWLMLELSPGVHEIDTGGTGSVSIPPDLGGGTLGPYTFATNYTITAFVPEPGSALLIFPGLLGMAAARRKLRVAKIEHRRRRRG